VKAVWSILLGLVMALGSFAVPASDTAHIRACSCCSCAQLDCCGTPVFPSPAPVTPPSKSTEQRVQTPAAVVIAVLAPSIGAKTQECSLPLLLFSRHPVAPLYERLCSYLI